MTTSAGVTHGWVTADSPDGVSEVGPSNLNDHVFAYLDPTGLTGATSASRYVGATTSGAPVSGTFAVGDFVIDQTGKFWVCTAAGSPGTWTAVGNGIYAFQGCSVSGTSTALNNGSYTSMAFNATDTFDSDGYHDPSSNNTRLTIPTGLGGKYLLTMVIVYPNTSTSNDRRGAYRVNGGTDVLISRDYYSLGTTTAQYINASTVIDLAAGDYVEVRGFVDVAGQTSGTYSAQLMRIDLGIQNVTPPAGELGYAQITSSFTVTKTQTTPGMDVTGLSVTVTVGSRPIKITAWATSFDSNTGNGSRNFMNIYDVTAGAQLAQGFDMNVATNATAITVIARVAPSAGSRTYKVQAWMDAGSSTDGRIFATSTSPAFIMVEEV